MLNRGLTPQVRKGKVSKLRQNFEGLKVLVHRTTEPHNGWGWWGPPEVICFNPLLKLDHLMKGSQDHV